MIGPERTWDDRELRAAADEEILVALDEALAKLAMEDADSSRYRPALFDRKSLTRSDVSRGQTLRRRNHKCHKRQMLLTLKQTRVKRRVSPESMKTEANLSLS